MSSSVIGWYGMLYISNIVITVLLVISDKYYLDL